MFFNFFVSFFRFHFLLKNFCVFLFFVSLSAFSKEKPLWEIGVGAGSVYQPYYVGTKQSRNVFFPVPIPIYRGDVFKSDDDGVRAEIIKDKRFRLNLSAGFNLAVDSDEVDLREGLDDIDHQFQIGPTLELTISKAQGYKWWLNFPLRASVSIGGNGLDGSGFTVSPSVNFARDFQVFNTVWTAKTSLEAQFGTSKYHDIYYSISEEFASDIRPAFNSGGGYSGSNLLLSFRSNNYKRLWLWFVRYENIDGAKFDDSPLVETNYGVSLGLIYSRYLFKSKRTVKRK